MQRGGSLAVWLLSAAAAGWPSTARAAEGLNLFPDPVQVAINVVVFLLLIYPTTRLLLRPLLRTFEERERRTTGALSRVDDLLAEAAEMRESLEARLEEARKRARGQRAGILRQAEEEEHRVLEEAREGAARTLEEARASIASEVGAAREELRAEADTLGREIASRVLGRRL